MTLAIYELMMRKYRMAPSPQRGGTLAAQNRADTVSPRWGSVVLNRVFFYQHAAPLGLLITSCYSAARATASNSSASA